MDLSVITVTWNSETTITEQIRSVILGCKNISWEEIIVDNASRDNTVSIIQKNFSTIKLISNKTNQGFSKSNNAAALLSAGKFLLFLNPDMRVEAGSLDGMVAWMRMHPEVGIASCRLTDESGKDKPNTWPRRFPTWRDQLAIILKIPHLFPAVLDHYLYKGFNPKD